MVGDQQTRTHCSFSCWPLAVTVSAQPTKWVWQYCVDIRFGDPPVTTSIVQEAAAAEDVSQEDRRPTATEVLLELQASPGPPRQRRFPAFNSDSDTLAHCLPSLAPLLHSLARFKHDICQVQLQQYNATLVCSRVLLGASWPCRQLSSCASTYNC